MKNSLPKFAWLTGLGAVMIFAQGCSTITNLTPGAMPRDPNNLYLFEVAWDSNQEVVREDSLEPKVVLDGELYPMEPTKLVSERWETFVPIPENVNSVTYRYRFDYKVKSVPQDRSESKLSPSYQLYIEDREY